jgi:protein MAK16
VPIKKKAERRDKIREQKASIVANLEKEIEAELLDRLKLGTYGDIYNFNQKAFSKVMNDREIESEEDELDDLENEKEEEKEVTL